MKTLLLLCAIFVVCSRADAQTTFNFVHILCVPEAGYLLVESKDIGGSGIIPVAESDDPLRAERIKVWANHGYFDPKDLHQECVIGEARYEVVANQYEPTGRGQCGGEVSVTLSLFRNHEPWLEKVLFSTTASTCVGILSVKRVEISEGSSGPRTMSVCTGDESDDCSFVSEKDGGISKLVPIGPLNLSEHGVVAR